MPETETLIGALNQTVNAYNIITIIIGVLIGQIIGAIPGMSSIMIISVAIPFTFTMGPVSAIALLMAFYKGALAGGSISAILLGTPGTTAASATLLDGIPLAKKGKAGKALQTAQISSALGGLFADVVLILFASFMGALALKFTSVEMLVVIAFSLLMIASFSVNNILKGILSGLLGMITGLVGIESATGLPRFDFGIVQLEGGFPLVSVLIGVLCFGTILNEILHGKTQQKLGHIPPARNKSDARMTRKDWKDSRLTILQGSIIGSIVGIMPGLGPTIGAFLSHQQARRTVRQPEKLGKGAIEGVAAAESGNSSVAGSNLVPLLSFGIPGDAEAALILGALLIQGIVPGANLFNENPDHVYGMMFSLVLVDIVLLITGLLIVRYFALPITKIQSKIIYPVIIFFMLVGVFAVDRSFFAVITTVIFGIVGFALIIFNGSLPAFVIGVILGPLFESYLQVTVSIYNARGLDIFLRPSFVVTFIIIVILSLLMFFSISKDTKIKKGSVTNDVEQDSTTHRKRENPNHLL